MLFMDNDLCEIMLEFCHKFPGQFSNFVVAAMKINPFWQQRDYFAI